ncbi:MAG TPA: alpha/beta fold hydrolase [Acidimicrobiales bacterium]|nr:alpha/beta fold hydrolase [Acidimicrobiales bacterium]
MDEAGGEELPEFASFDGVRLHYELEGSGPPVVLLHSFPFDSRVWVDTGVAAGLVEGGRQAVLLDRRGQGRSEKPHDPAAYADNACARDVFALLDHLGLDWSDLLAYSLGAQIGLRVLQVERRIRRAVLGGIGEAVLGWNEGAAIAVAEVLERDEAELDEGDRALRARVDRLGGDRFALGAMGRGRYVNYDRDFSMVGAAVLIINGERDLDFGDPARLAALIPRATATFIDADHASTMDNLQFLRLAPSFLAVGVGGAD